LLYAAVVAAVFVTIAVVAVAAVWSSVEHQGTGAARHQVRNGRHEMANTYIQISTLPAKEQPQLLLAKTA